MRLWASSVSSELVDKKPHSQLRQAPLHATGNSLKSTQATPSMTNCKSASTNRLIMNEEDTSVAKRCITTHLRALYLAVQHNATGSSRTGFTCSCHDGHAYGHLQLHQDMTKPCSPVVKPLNSECHIVPLQAAVSPASLDTVASVRECCIRSIVLDEGLCDSFLQASGMKPNDTEAHNIDGAVQLPAFSLPGGNSGEADGSTMLCGDRGVGTTTGGTPTAAQAEESHVDEVPIIADHEAV